MNDKMSQEDIDRMMKGESADAPEVDSADQNGYLTKDEKDTLGEISNIFMGSASTTLAMLLSNKVEITTPAVVEYDKVGESFIADGDHVVVEIKYVEGLQGTTLFALKTPDTAIIADLMMGGDGSSPDPEIGEIQLSAVSEAMNQMVGTASTSLSSMFNFAINISHPEVSRQKSGEPLNLSEEISTHPLVAVKFNLIIGNLINSEIIQLMSVEAAQSQVKSLMDMMSNVSKDLASSMNHNESVAETAVKGMDNTQSTSAVSGHTTPITSPSQDYNVPPSIPQQAQEYVNQQTSFNAQPEAQDQSPVTVQPVQFASFDGNANMQGEANKNLNLVMDVKLRLTVELGRTELPIKNVLELTRGSIVELEKIAGEAVDLFANGKLIARGEVVVIEDNFGLRITTIVSPENRIKDL